MKRIIVLLILILMGGCEQALIETPEVENIQSEPGSNIVVAEPVPDDIVLINSESASDLFLAFTSLAVHNGWVYYIIEGKSELRKCRPDLSEDAVDFPSGLRPPFILNPDGYIVGDKNIYNLNDGSYSENRLASNGDLCINTILYKNSFYMIDVKYLANRSITQYNLKGDYVKTIYEGHVDSFAIIDDTLYFMPEFRDDNGVFYSDTVMRYDLVEGTTEEAFGFDIKEIPWSSGEYFMNSSIFYDKRNIIVVNSTNSFVYTSVEEISLKEVDLSFTKSQWDHPFYICSNDEDLYFAMLYFTADNGTPFSDYMEYYKVINGTTQPVFLKRIDGAHRALFISDGYLYYHNYPDFNNFDMAERDKSMELKREKL